MKYLLLGLIPLFFGACSPKYVIKTLYTQPTTKEGKIALAECNIKRETCQTHCNQGYNSCLSQAKEQAKKHFPLILDEYSEVMHDYEAEINRYEGEIESWDHKHIRVEQQFQTYRELCNSKKDRKSYECRRAKESERELEDLENIEPTPPARPEKPLLSNEIKKAQKKCSNRCGCQKEYDNCFISSGGTLDYKKFCVENCK